MKSGGQTKYLPEYCQLVISMGGNGMAISQVAAEIGVRRATIYNWQKQYPEFADACELHQELSEAWWTELGRQISLGNVKSPPVSYIYNMKVRFGKQWKDDGTTNKLEVTTKYQNSSDEELTKMIRHKLASKVLRIEEQLPQGELIIQQEDLINVGRTGQPE